MTKTLIHTAFLFFFFFSNFAFSTDTTLTRKIMFGTIPVVIVKGENEEMGIQYGSAMRTELNEELSILKKFYIDKNKIPYKKIRDHAELLYGRYPHNFQLFLKGISKGSYLKLDDVKILNAMETLGYLTSKKEEPKCAFLSVPNYKTKTSSHLIGRNYDYPPPYDQLSKYLTVTVLKEKNKIPTAFVSIAGEIYCPSCINANGLFMELNNGSPSGGHEVNTDRQSLLINMLQILQNSKDMTQATEQLNATESDYSLIVNVADSLQTKSFEFSSTLGVKSVTPNINEIYSSTNFYQSAAWKNIPAPSDTSTWLGVTRRNNLLNLANNVEQIDLSDFENLMNKNLEEGGAVWKMTIYQLIFDPKDLSLYVKVNHHGNNWNKIPLKTLFA